jgi:hypothetical protein
MLGRPEKIINSRKKAGAKESNQKQSSGEGSQHGVHLVQEIVRWTAGAQLGE